MTKQNPFAAHRWETEHVHLIWVPPTIARVAAQKPCLISGLRGTGKTVLLNCIDLLAPQKKNYRFLNPEALPSKCIGVYINIVSEFTDFFRFLDSVDLGQDRAVVSHGGGASMQGLAFQTYVILNSLARTFEVVDQCRRSEILKYSADSEVEFVRRANLVGQFTAKNRKTASSLLEFASELKKSAWRFGSIASASIQSA